MDPTLSDTLTSLLGQAKLAVSSVVRVEVEKSSGLRRAEYMLLTLVVERQVSTNSQLAVLLAVQPPRVSVLLDKLIDRGFVVRRQSNLDRRSWLVTATDIGREVARLATHAVCSREADVLSRLLSTNERSDLERLLRKLVAAQNCRRAC